MEPPDAFLVGYHSLLAPERPIKFLSIPKNPATEEMPHHLTLERLLWFSNAFLTIEPIPGGFIASDWLFAEFQSTPGARPVALFAWRIDNDGTVTPLRAKFDASERLREIFDAMF